MGKLKLKNKITIVIICFILCIVIFYIFFFCNEQYIYESKITQILDIDKVEIRDKSISESGAIGEWYVCETYDLTKEDFNSFLVGNRQNKLYLSDGVWIRKNWENLPIDSQYNEIKNMVTSVPLKLGRY
ncbi:MULTISPECIES: hypothetical protein [unclassified Dysgonomonas]|uniref:hypothetical protein n=1 Tax=unclassified Dysgonomonas TaxID=2630389 RepID=UPI0024758E28|nr:MULTISPECIES: hypothetical protein [unclassified Dysgonomonas]